MFYHIKYKVTVTFLLLLFCGKLLFYELFLLILASPILVGLSKNFLLAFIHYHLILVTMPSVQHKKDIQCVLLDFLQIYKWQMRRG